jgi:ABC-type multidrug transport system fused ATPase/permease subunit
MYLRVIYNTAIKQRIVQIQRNRIFERYIKADTEYHDSIPVGNLVNVITTEVNRAVTGIMAPLELIVYLIMLFGYLTMLSVLSWQMTLLSIVILLLASRVPTIWIKKSKYAGRKLVDANTIMSEFLVGRLRSPRLVRLSSTETAEKNEFHNLTQAQRKYVVFSSILQAKTDLSMEPILIALSLVFLYFSHTILHLQIEIIGLYLVIILRLLPIIKEIIAQWQIMQVSLGSVEVIENRLKDMKNHVEKDYGTKKISRLSRSILIDNVSYRYQNCKDYALENITFEIKANTTTAIVGASGSGKSTLIDLFPRLRLPSSGSVIIDGVDIERYTLRSIRELISYAPQSPQLFDSTVKEHILYGKSNATDKEIRESVFLAGAEEFINKLPNGFNTTLGEDAVKLSGGQRQRLDLARALVKKAPILILDEPTSNLDAESSEMFNKSISRIRKQADTTIIIIAHGLKSISNSDNIIVLNQGKIEASGIHSDLLVENGWYAKAWKSQDTES